MSGAETKTRVVQTETKTQPETKTDQAKPETKTAAAERVRRARARVQASHPDMGGTAADFIKAKLELERAKQAVKRAVAKPRATRAEMAAREAARQRAFQARWPDGMPSIREMEALHRMGLNLDAANLATLRRASEARAAETKTSAAQPETKTRNRGGRPPGVSAFAAWVLETKTPRASAYRQWGAFMSATGETKTAARADAAALAKFLRWRKA